MHTTTSSDVTFHHNGDFSGDIEIERGGQRMQVPFDAIKDLVGEYVRSTILNGVENMKPGELVDLGMARIMFGAG